jgi:hypothetical protein
MTTIGDIAYQAGIETSTIRYYERVGLLPRPKRVSCDSDSVMPFGVSEHCHKCHSQRCDSAINPVTSRCNSKNVTIF